MSSSSKAMSIGTAVSLFIVALILEQVYDLFVYADLPLWSYSLLYLLIPCISLIAFVLFVKLTRSSFKRQGYKKPGGISTLKCVLLSIFFLIVYLFIILAQGFFGEFGTITFPSTAFSVIYKIAVAVVYGLFTESVFRGYIFRNFAGYYGLFTSLYTSSLLFSLYTISLREIEFITTDPIMYIFTRIIPSLAIGLFLGFFFYKIRWSLLGPLIFRIGFLFLFFEPVPSIISVKSPWWIALTFEMLAFAALILLADTIIPEPQYRRKRYGLQE